MRVDGGNRSCLGSPPSPAQRCTPVAAVPLAGSLRLAPCIAALYAGEMKIRDVAISASPALDALARAADQIGYTPARINTVVSAQGRQAFAYMADRRGDPDRLAAHLRQQLQQPVDWSAAGGYCTFKTIGSTQRVVDALPHVPADLRWWDDRHGMSAIDAAAALAERSQAQIDGLPALTGAGRRRACL